MPGPPPKPTKLKLLKGEKNKDRINQNEPQPEVKVLPCPSHLKEEAKRYWNQEAPRLYQLGLLTEVDGGAFELLCVAWAEWQEYTELVEKNGIAIRTPNGSLQLSPAAVLKDRAYERYRRMCLEFGMTPSSRSRISVSKPHKGSGIEDLID